MNRIAVCKTFIRRFDPGPRLQSKPQSNLQLVIQTTHFSTRLEGLKSGQWAGKNGEALAKCLTASLTRILTADSDRQLTRFAPEVCL